MSPDKISKRILADRLDWIYSMLKDIESLPLDNYELFIQERRNVWAAKSCLRRALEAMLDLGRHVIAKGMGQGVTEYREIPGHLAQAGILSAENTRIMKKMAGYRNRLVHFYHEVSIMELYDICVNHLQELRSVSREIQEWINAHPEYLDSRL